MVARAACAASRILPLACCAPRRAICLSSPAADDALTHFFFRLWHGADLRSAARDDRTFAVHFRRRALVAGLRELRARTSSPRRAARFRDDGALARIPRAPPPRVGGRRAHSGRAVAGAALRRSAVRARVLRQHEERPTPLV